jgi:hypothetical protein
MHNNPPSDIQFHFQLNIGHAKTCKTSKTLKAKSSKPFARPMSEETMTQIEEAVKA